MRIVNATQTHLDFFSRELDREREEALKKSSPWNTIVDLDDSCHWEQQKFVALDASGCQVGIAILKIICDSHATIDRLYVPLLYRGNGVGTQLVSHCITKAREENRTTLGVETTSDSHMFWIRFLDLDGRTGKSPGMYELKH